MSATKFSRPAAQHPLWAAPCGAEGRKQSKQIGEYPLASSFIQGGGGDLVLSPSSGFQLPAWLCSFSLSLSARRPPNFPGLRRSTRCGLACGAEGRKQSKQIGDCCTLLPGGGVIWSSALAPLGSALSLPLPFSSAVGHQIFSACGAAPTLGWPAAQKAESRASGRSGASPQP